MLQWGCSVSRASPLIRRVPMHRLQANAVDKSSSGESLVPVIKMLLRAQQSLLQLPEMLQPAFSAAHD